MTQTPEGCSSMRKALKVLEKELNCYVERKNRKGELYIISPSGAEITVSGTRTDIPRNLAKFIQTLRNNK